MGPCNRAASNGARQAPRRRADRQSQSSDVFGFLATPRASAQERAILLINIGHATNCKPLSMYLNASTLAGNTHMAASMNISHPWR